MLYYIIIAFSNGIFIGSSRAINGRLSEKSSPFTAALWNHIVGFSFLTVILLLVGIKQFDMITHLPLTGLLGGFFGALFVAVSSCVFSKLGALNAAILIIAGQMMTAVLLDWHSTGNIPSILRLIGVVIVLIGIYFSKSTSENKQ